MIDLCLSMYDRAKFRRKKRAVEERSFLHGIYSSLLDSFPENERIPLTRVRHDPSLQRQAHSLVSPRNTKSKTKNL